MELAQSVGAIRHRPLIVVTGNEFGMSSSVILGALNRLFASHCQSVPLYLSQTRPWISPKNGKVKEVLDLMVSDQRIMIDRIAALIDRFGGEPDRGQGKDLTRLNDLSLDFLLQRVIEFQRDDILEIESCVTDLEDDAESKGLAQEALGMAKGHLDSLEEVARDVANPTFT